MTSGEFTSFPIDSITVDRPARQRTEVGDVKDLADSIKRNGLINPIVITRDGVLVAGERRLTACRSLGWTSIPVQFTDDLSSDALYLLELEENIKRKDLSWQDEVKAVAHYHQLRAETEEGWTQAATAKELGVTNATISNKLLVAGHMNDPAVAEAQRFSVALGLVNRKIERAKVLEIDKLAGGHATAPVVDMPELEVDIPPIKVDDITPSPIRFGCADFCEWVEGKMTGGPFNFIHCDFPYGVEYGERGTAYSKEKAQVVDAYDDSFSTYEKLLDALARMDERGGIASQCHLMFWFSMYHYTYTVERLEGMGWTVFPFPLIWHKSDNTGMVGDTQRHPRKTYETALLAWKGDRKLVRPKAASFSNGAERATRRHISQKPESVLEHFFAMLVDESTVMLDPTAGSGTALRVAERLGANTIVGLEIDRATYQETRRWLFEESE